MDAVEREPPERLGEVDPDRALERDEGVQSAEVLDGALDDVGAHRAVREIAGQQRDDAALGTGDGCGDLGLLGVVPAVADRDVCAGARVGQGDLSTESGIPVGDEGFAPAQAAGCGSDSMGIQGITSRSVRRRASAATRSAA